MSFADLSHAFRPADLSRQVNPTEVAERIRRKALIQFGRISTLSPEGENDPMHAMAIGQTGQGKTTLCLSLLRNWYANTKRTIIIIELGKKGESIELGKEFGEENVIVHIPEWLSEGFSIRSRQQYTLMTYDSAWDLLYNIQPRKINIDLGFQAYLDLYNTDRKKKKEFRQFISEFNAVIRERFMDLFPATVYIEEAKNLIPAKGHAIVQEQMDLSNNLASFIQGARGFGFNLLAATQGFNLINPEARNEFQYQFYFKVRGMDALGDPYLKYFWYSWIRKKLPKHHFFFFVDPGCYFPAGCIPRDQIPFAPQPVGLRFFVKPSTEAEGDGELGEKVWEKYKQLRNVRGVAVHLGITFGSARYWIDKHKQKEAEKIIEPSPEAGGGGENKIA